jgi:hypothetical protein
LPETVVVEPMMPSLGLMLRMPMLEAGVAGAAMGPGNGATPGIVGGVRTIGVVESWAEIAELAAVPVMTDAQRSATVTVTALATPTFRDQMRFFMGILSGCDRLRFAPKSLGAIVPPSEMPN